MLGRSRTERINLNSPRSPYPYEFEGISLFLQEIFLDSISPLYDDLGTETFLNYIDPERLQERNREGDRYSQFLIEDSEGIVGFMEFRDGSHVSLLFVKKVHQRKGWGKKLLDFAESLAKEHHHSDMTLNASPNSKEAYLTLGFIEQSELRMVNGVIFFEMKKVI
jgi:GNAT superfamily N-acetyltransferase